MIVYCQGTYDERVGQTLEAIKRLGKPNVDRVVIITDQSVSDDQEQQLRDAGAEVYKHQWNDNFPEMRNHYLEKVQDGDWVIVSDPDEWFGEKFATDVRKLCAEADERGIRLLLINSHDQSIVDGEITCDNKSSYYKNLVFKYKPGTRYEGVGTCKTVHERLIQTAMGSEAKLPDEYFYTHRKEQWEVWERATRNLWASGGGNNVGDRNPSWKKLKEIAAGLGINDWRGLRDYMRKGDIDSKLREWLHENRQMGYDWQNEMVDAWRWYFVYLHPEENVDGLQPLPAKDVRSDEMAFVEAAYMKILGRHADTEGKEHYSDMLSRGEITRQDLINALANSEEAKRKVAIGNVTSAVARPPTGEMPNVMELLARTVNMLVHDVKVLAAEMTAQGNAIKELEKLVRARSGA